MKKFTSRRKRRSLIPHLSFQRLEMRHLLAGPHAPAAGEIGSTAIGKDDSALVAWASAVVEYTAGTNVDVEFQTPAKSLGPAEGTAGDVVSLGRGGQITLGFDAPIRDGLGADFAVFENSISDTFLELGYVEVSSDGVHFFRFASDSLTPSAVDAFGSVDPTDVHNLAGKYRQGFGVPFDLQELSGVDPMLDTTRVTHVRLVDVIGDGAALDADGDPIFDPYPTVGSAGLDVDAVGVIHQAQRSSDVIGFEDLGASLAAQSAFSGPVAGGTMTTGPSGDTVVVGSFESETLSFNNAFSNDFGSWSGWAYSNATDTTTPGFGNQFSAFAGGGASGSETFGVAFPSPESSITRDSSDTRLFDSLQVTNTTYAVLSMQNGDAFAKKFGGDSGNDPDFLLLSIDGKDASGASIGIVNFYLADYRFSDNSMDYIVDDWREVDLTSIAMARSLEFAITSSDVGAFGINTPTYVAVDDLRLSAPVLPIDITDTQVNEADGNAATTVRISRSDSDLSSAINVTIAAVDPGIAQVPTSVVIPANSRFVEFPVNLVDNNLVDGDRTITIQASADGFVGSSRSLTVQDDDVLTLVASIGESSVTEGDAIVVTVSRNDADTSEALELQVSTPATDRLSFSTPISIPANQSTVAFSIDAVDDGIDKPDQQVTVSIGATGYASDSFSFLVTDDDEPTILVESSVANFSESLASPTATLEDLGAMLGPMSFYNGSDEAGGFSSQGLTFNNDFDSSFGSWSGWAFSNTADTTTAGFTNQYSAVTGIGADQSDTYAVASAFSASSITRDATAADFSTIAITNTTYAALSMMQGDSFAKQFGGASGDDPDFFLLTIDGKDTNGDTIGAVEFYLADYRFSDNSLDYIVDEWTTVDLSSISQAISLDFLLSSSDTGSFGINTPAYFAADNVTLVSTELAPTITVTRNTADLDTPLQVSLASDDLSEILVPALIEIPAQQASVEVPIQIVEDTLSDGNQVVSLVAEADGHVGSTLELTVSDTDDMALTLTVQTNNVVESTGQGSLVLHRNVLDTSSSLVVDLQASLANELVLPTPATIPAGARSVVVEFAAVDNDVIDADRDVSIQASATGFASGEDTVTVVNDDFPPPQLTLEFDRDSIDESSAALTVPFEYFGRSLVAEAFYNGADMADGFTTRGVEFNNSYNAQFGSWEGWAVSNVSDNTTPGFANQYSAVPGSGALQSSTYAIGNAFSSDSPATLIEATATANGFGSLMITNTTYAALSMRDGDSFAKRFGGESGDDPDFFLLHIEGVDQSGESVGVIDFYLADYRFEDNSQDYIVDDWELVDVSSLVGARELRFTLSSSDVGDFGMNTPAYFAIDQIVLNDSDPTGVQATVTRNDMDLSEELVVQIENGDHTELAVPGSVTIPVGAESVDFMIQAVDDSLFDSDVSVMLTATAPTHESDSEALEVVNSQPKQLSVDFAFDEYTETDVSAEVVVHRNTENLTQPLTVLLTSTDGLSVPSEVIIPANAAAVSVTVGVIDNDSIDVFTVESVTASAEDFREGMYTVVVNDDEYAGLVVTETDDSTSVSEPIGVDTVSVALGGQPQSDVLVHVSIDGQDAAVSVAQLTFTPEEWDQSQVIDVRALGDWFVEEDETVSLRLSVDASQSDSLFVSLEDTVVPVTIRDYQSAVARLTENEESIVVLDDATSDVVQYAAHRHGLQLVANDLAQTIVVEPLAQARGLIQVDTAGGDDIVILSGTRFTSLNGGDGYDQLIVRLDDPSVDLIDLLDNRVFGFEELLVDGAAETQWTIDLDRLPAIVGGDDALLLRLAVGQSVSFEGRVQSDPPVMVQNDFAQVIRSGQTVVHVVSETPWRNVADLYDVNQSGDVTPLDALLIINELSVSGSVELPKLASLQDFTGYFLDVTGDDALSPLDVLRVLNRLALETNGNAPSSEQIDRLVRQPSSAFLTDDQGDTLNTEIVEANSVLDEAVTEKSHDQAISDMFLSAPRSDLTVESAFSYGDAPTLTDDEINLLSDSMSI